MMRRTMRYALIDLANQTTVVKEITADDFGTWGVLFDEMDFWWKADPDVVALTTGVLTGSGAPGTGASSWCFLQDGAPRCVAWEGRLGAWLRCGGIDSVIFLGKSREPCRVMFSNGKIRLERGSADYPTLLAGREDPNAVIAVVTRKAVTEDKYFVISDRSVADRLFDKGLCAIVAEPTGRLEIADPVRMAELAAEMTRTAIRSGRLLGSGRTEPARYLSLDHTVRFQKPTSYNSPVASFKDLVYASLGIIWSEALAGMDRKRITAELLTACTGTPCREEEIDALAEQLTRVMENTGKGDA